MSVIVAIRDGDGVLIGCDSQFSLDSSKYCLYKLQRKIWNPDDDKDIVMGVTGDLRDLNILSTAEGWIDEHTKAMDGVNLKYVIRHIVPKIFHELGRFGRIKTRDGIESIISDVIFAYKNKAFKICWDGAVFEMEDMLVIGSGEVAVAGTWSSIKDLDMPAKEKLIRMVRSACDNNVYVEEPIIITSTKSNNFEIIGK